MSSISDTVDNLCVAAHHRIKIVWDITD